jgi:hypothetical protein
MSTKVTYAILAATVILLAATLPLHAQNLPPAPPDETLYTSYFFSSNFQDATWIVCGSTEQSEGCYGSGELGPFGKIGALMESNASVSSSTVTRAIYVLDCNTSTSGVDLYVYKKTDVVSASSDTITVTLLKTISLSLTGGSTAVCSMAGNRNYLFIGTNQSPQAAEVQKSNLSVTMVGGFSPPINVTSITSDAYGYVTVTFGGFLSGEDGFYTFGPNGEGEGDGGGAWFMLNPDLAVSTANLPSSDEKPSRPVGYHMKSTQPTGK